MNPKLQKLLEENELDWGNQHHREMYLKHWLSRSYQQADSDIQAAKKIAVSNPWEWARITPDGPAIKTSVTAEEADELGRLAAGRDCLETGSASGYSAIMMARYGARSVTTVDLHEPCDSNNMSQTYEALLSNIRAFDVASVITVIRGSSQLVLPQLQDRRFGLVFIDGGHSYENARHDISWALKLAAEDGFIACHDYGHPGSGRYSGIPDVTQVLDEVFPGGPDHVTGSLHVTRMKKEGV